MCHLHALLFLLQYKSVTLLRWALCKCGFERGHNLIDFDISSNVRARPPANFNTTFLFQITPIIRYVTVNAA